LGSVKQKARQSRKLDGWGGLVDGHVAEARTILDAALADRMTFTKEVDAQGREVWTLTAPLAWDKVLMRLAPDNFTGRHKLVKTRAGSEQPLCGLRETRVVRFAA
jgi:hypothetical protein